MATAAAALVAVYTYPPNVRRTHMDQLDQRHSNITNQDPQQIDYADTIRREIKAEKPSFLERFFSFLPKPPYTPPPMYYVITPSYVPYKEAVDASVFLTNDKETSIRVLDYLNSLDINHPIIKHIHNIAKDTIDHEPVAPKFRLLRFTPGFMLFRTTVPISKLKLDFLLVDGLINQDIDKVASSNRNQITFGADALKPFRKHFNDKHII